MMPGGDKGRSHGTEREEEEGVGWRSKRKIEEAVHQYAEASRQGPDSGFAPKP